MIDNLFHLLQEPELWQRSTTPFWDDEHISKGMLKAHLNPDLNAASRKHSYIDCSVKWLSSVIPAKSKILDLGCGPGLYTKRLSDMGYNVTGIDYSKRSIAYAKSQDTRTEYIYKNYLDLEYSDKFDAVTLIYCDYAALTPFERKALMEKIYKALKPGGLFIFDVFTEKHFSNKENKSTWALYENGGFWNAMPHICFEASYLYENNTVSVDKYVIVGRTEINEYLIWDTVFTVKKIVDEITPFGFLVKGVFDDMCGNTYTGEEETLCFILKRS